MGNMVNEQEFQSRAMQVGVLQKNMEEITVMLNTIEQKKLELSSTISALKGLKEKTDILTPLGIGLFVPGSLKADSKPLVAIGANILVEKTPEQAEVMLQDQAKDLEKTQEDLKVELEKITKQLQILEQELVQMYQEMEKEKK